MRYNKIKGILRARQGSHIPKYQNPFGPITVTTIDHRKEALKAMLSYKKDNLLIDLKKISSTFNTLGQGANLTKNLFNLSTNTSALTNTLNSAYDSASSALMSFSPIGTIVGGAMKIGGFIGDGLSALGVGTDLITTTDLILDSNFMKLTPIGLVNSMFAEKTQNFSADADTIEQVGSSYSDSVHDINNAVAKSNKKYGLLSSRARNKANNYINNAKTQLNTITRIANIAEKLQAMSNDISNYSFNLNGGYDLRYMRAAKSGMKLLDKIDFIKNEVNIRTVINLNTKEIEWNPIIEEAEDWEPVIEYKEGGNLPELWEPVIEDTISWEPIITIEEFKEGGTIKEELESPEIEETNQKNLIPEGALHKNKHHMENTEGLTLKGIPVIDNEGEQLAEIELDEIIFTLEVTKKLEELYKEGTDEAAIEAGKLLVKEILFNTDDRTGLIAKCEKGGKLDEIS